MSTHSIATRIAICLAMISASTVRAQNDQKSSSTKIFESDDTATTLVELFTSEGCSSCPPAEKWLSAFKTDPGLWKRIVPLAFHVDYWDRLGWRDRLAKPEFTERQKRYAASWKGESVYTPGFAVDGREWRGWFNGSSLPTKETKAGKLRVTLASDGTVTGLFSPAGPVAAPLILEAALLGGDLESEVKAGENNGRKLHHDFVVLSLGHNEMSTGGDHYAGSISLPVTGNDAPVALAAWIRSRDNIEPLQATGGWLAAGR